MHNSEKLWGNNTVYPNMQTEIMSRRLDIYVWIFREMSKYKFGSYQYIDRLFLSHETGWDDQGRKVNGKGMSSKD